MSYFCIFMNLNAYHSEIWLVFFNNLRAVPTAINTSFLSALKKPPRKRKLKAALESTKKERKKRRHRFFIRKRFRRSERGTKKLPFSRWEETTSI